MDLNQVKILVVGDVMLDKYISGSVNRISPEAPVPILDVDSIEYSLGGAGNVANNIASLGANVELMGAIGNDEEGELVQRLLLEQKIRNRLFITEDIRTTLKTRLVADPYKTPMFRFDREDRKKIEFPKFDLKSEKYNFIVVSDYAKGMITYNLMSRLHEMNIPIILDPKPSHRDFYWDIFLMTPNKKEYSEMETLIDEEAANILITEGSEGMTLIQNNLEEFKISAVSRPVYNPSGAGDTVISVITACLSLGCDLLTSAKIANECAGNVVSRPGTSPIQLGEFYNAFSKFKSDFKFSRERKNPS